jgi:hypothetical protein
MVLVDYIGIFFTCGNTFGHILYIRIFTRFLIIFKIYGIHQGRIKGGGDARPPLKLEKNMIFWRKIVIFHTKYPKHFRASLRSAQFF